MRVAWIVVATVTGSALALAASAQQSRPSAPAAAASPAPTPLPTLSRTVPQRDRDAAYAYYRAEVAAGRCPPPLVRKAKVCAAPAPAKPAWKLDQPLADAIKTEPPPAALIGKLSPSPAGYHYARVGNEILIVGLGTRIVAAQVADLSQL